MGRSKSALVSAVGFFKLAVVGSIPNGGPLNVKTNQHMCGQT